MVSPTLAHHQTPQPLRAGHSEIINERRHRTVGIDRDMECLVHIEFVPGRLVDQDDDIESRKRGPHRSDVIHVM